jgi:tetratricopeptide (TPR) repeat protein
MKTSAQELFLQANQCYAKKDFKGAEHLYQKIPKKTAAIWYNLGNCAYKNGDELQALLYWQRAKKIGNSTISNDSGYNCDVVSKKLNLPPSSYTLMPNIPALPLQILFFCTFSVFLIFNRKLWNAKRFTLLVSLSILVMGAAAMTYASYRNSTNTYALIMHDESTMYAGPDIGYHEVAKIPKGNRVKVLEQKNHWSKICWSGYTGWMQDEKIELI